MSTCILEEQAGFRVGRGCRDQIFVMRRLAEKTIEKDDTMYAAFFDLEKAYDKVWREDMWRTLATCGVSGRLLRVVIALYGNSRVRVRVEDECFEARQRVRQGWPLYPWLFNVFWTWWPEKQGLSLMEESDWTSVQCNS